MREVFAYNELTLKLLGDRKHLSEMGNGDKHYKKKKKRKAENRVRSAEHEKLQF